MKKILILIILLAITACKTNTNNGDDMTVTIIDENITLTDTNITENVPAFSNLERYYSKDQQVTSGNFVYQRIGEDVNIPQFDSSKTDYELNDLVFTDKVEYVSQLTGEQLVAKQPETYTIDTSPLPANWVNRYTKLGSFNNNEIALEETFSDENYRYIFNMQDSDIQTKIYHSYFKFTYDVEFSSGSGSNIIDTIVASGVGTTAYLLKTVNSVVESSVKITDDFQLGVEYTVDGKRVIGEREESTFAREDYSDADWTQLTGDYTESTIARHYSYNLYAEELIVDNSVTYLAQSTLNVAEEKAGLAYDQGVFVADGAFTPKCYIVRGLDLYMRTNIDAEQETETVDVSDVQTTPITSPTTIDWGWAILRPTMKYAILDSEKSTKLTSKNSVYLNFTSSVKFDTIILNSLVASKITITINGDTIERNPINELSMNGKTIIATKNVATYLDKMYNAGDTILIEIEPLNGFLELGGVYIGEKFIVGSTMIPFTTSTKAIQTLTYNKFGKAEYVDRAIVEKYSASVMFNSKYYSFLYAFFKPLAGGKKAFFDGTDNLKNLDHDTNKIINPTAMMGRMVEHPMQYVEDNGHESDYNEMKIDIREDA